MKFYEVLKKEAVLVERKKGQHLFFQGNSDKYLYFVQSGLLKAYYTSADGKDFVKSFIQASEIIGSVGSAFADLDCSFGLICLEDSILQRLPLQILIDYGKKDLGLANELIQFLLQLAMKKERRDYEFLCLSAEQRYRQLRQDSAKLIERITQNDLAQYLGVTAVGLSRIKKRIEQCEL